VKDETRDWKLKGTLYWAQKDGATITCSLCNGKGVLDGFGFIDGPETCSQCYGRGSIDRPDKEPKPEVPEELVKRLRDVWEEFFD